MNAATEDEIDDEIHSRYQIGTQLGKGAYGVVWKAVDKLRPNRVRLVATLYKITMHSNS